MAECSTCGETFDEAQLNITASGKVCDLCSADAHADGLNMGTFARAKAILIGAAVATAASFVISVRSESTSSWGSSSGGVEIIERGPDLPGLIASGVGALAGLACLVVVLGSKPTDPTDKDEIVALRKRKLIFALIAIVVIAAAVYRLYDARGYSTKTEW